MTPNHVSYIDAFVLSAASPRPVRFLMSRDWYDKPKIGWFVRLFDCIPVSRSKAAEAIRKAVACLDAGDVVCIFPEGGLTPDGRLKELQRGCQLIARKARVPVVPVRLEGLWGSVFSHREGPPLRKIAGTILRGIRVKFYAPISYSDINLEELRQMLDSGEGSAGEKKGDETLVN